jgi:phosphoenolpyruvate carboxylase
VLDVSNRSRVDVAEVERTGEVLLRAFRRVLGELGQDQAGHLLPLVGETVATGDGKGSTPPALAPGALDRTGLRALTMAFHLLSLAEQRASGAHRARARAAGKVESGLWLSVMEELARRLGQPVTPEEALDDLWVEPVLTAHPTEARRVSALEQWNGLFETLSRVDAAHATALDAREDDEDELLARLERLFCTGEVRLRKPSLADERNVVIHTLVEVVAQALGEVSKGVLDAFPDTRDEPETRGRLRLTFGTWVGGDRDGHPGVTPEVTAESLLAYRRAAFDLHQRNLKGLARALSVSRWNVDCPTDLDRGIATLANRLGAAGTPALERNPEEPFRTMIGLMLAAMPEADAPIAGQVGYRDPAELADDLRLVRQALVDIGAGRLARYHVDPVLNAVLVFGFHLVTLDLRQNSATHDKAVEALLQDAGAKDWAFSRWSEGDRRAWLLGELETSRPLVPPGTTLRPEAEVAVGPYRALVAHRERFGDAGLGASIVSMTRQVSDLLVPWLLAREAGLPLTALEASPLVAQVVPLFETLDDLHRAPEVMDDYLSLPLVQRRFAGTSRDAEDRRPVQQVMVGYSDSNKDAGPTASAWAVHGAQRHLLETGRRHGIGMRFFHGRGGSTSRGAGPTYRFSSALPRGAVDEGLRLTEQGETIFQKLGTVEAAAYNLELLLAGTMRRQVLDRHAAAPGKAAASGDGRVATDEEADLRGSLDVVAEASRAAYRALVESPGFVDFFREGTPVDIIERSAIGSRPARRSGANTLSDLRAIPWVFSWTQSRFVLSGWYGLGAGFAVLEARDRAAFDRLCASALDWPPLRYIVGNVSVSVLTARPDMMAAYADLVRDESLRERVLAEIHGELDRTRRVLEKIYGGRLEEARGRIHALMAMREPSLERVHLHQVDLLRTWRTAGRRDDEMRVELLATVNAIAAGLRTTG